MLIGLLGAVEARTVPPVKFLIRPSAWMTQSMPGRLRAALTARLIFR